MKVMNFHLSGNWNHDLLRDILGSLEKGELKDMVNEFSPFNAEFSHNLKSALDEDDMKSVGLWHKDTLLSRFKSKTQFDYGQGQRMSESKLDSFKVVEGMKEGTKKATNDSE